jgi:hypothetical protein
MKRLLTLLITVFVAAPLVAATTHEACQAVFNDGPPFTSYKESAPDGADAYNQTTVDIVANFTKDLPASNVNASLVRGSNDQTVGITRSPNEGESATYTYQPSNARIADGTYYLSVAGNDGYITRRSCVTFAVDTPQMDIWVNSPSPTEIERPTFAYSDQQQFNVTLATEREGLCRMAYAADVGGLGNLSEAYEQIGSRNQLTDQPATTHTDRVTINTVNNRKAYDVICQETSGQDEGDQYAYQRIQTGYQPDPTPVNLTVRPASLIEYTNRYVNITTTSQSDVLCTINDSADLLTDLNPTPWTDPASTDYTQRRTYEAEVPESGTTTVNATCTNKAGFTTTATASLEADYDASNTIRVEQPGDEPTNADQIPLTVSTSGSGQTCTATINDDEHTLNAEGLQVSRYYHTTNITLPSDGTYTANITCLQGNIPTSTTTTIAYDTTPPEPSSITTNNYACSTDQASFTLTHNETTELSYTVRNNDNASQIYDQDTLETDEWDATADLPGLEPNTTIRVDATATDPAGNNQTSTAQLVVKEQTATVCDRTPPTLTLEQQPMNQSTDTVIYDVSCDDNRACQQTYDYSIENHPGQCAYDQQNNQNTSIRIQQNGYLCVAVYDQNNNNDTATRSIKQALPPHCSDQTQNVNETGIDCGGPQSSCALCGQGQTCQTNKDCYPTLTCRNGACQQPLQHCSNGIQDQGETGVDCGGPDCAPCTNNSDPGNNSETTCSTDSDCASNICTDGTCAAPTCSDGVKNQFETAVDCGGPNCAACEATPGKPCETDSQCPGPRFACDQVQGVSQCVQTPAHCSNGEQDQGETGVDCGGPDCSACEIDQSCQANTDCLSGLCANNTCAAPSCSDGVQNQGESDVDCGSVCSTQCQIGDTCDVDADCTTRNCNTDTGLCIEASCTNDKQDGDETDVDCGGNTCVEQGLTCANGQNCERDADCASGLCATDGTCKIPPNKDSDNDGLPDRWEKEHGATPDGDGYTNLEEYEAGTDPNDESSHPTPPENNTPAYILLITGFLFIGAGGGLIYYDIDESETTPSPSPATPREPTPEQQRQPQETQDISHEEPVEDDDTTMAELEAERDELLSSFEDDAADDSMNFTTAANTDTKQTSNDGQRTAASDDAGVEPPSHPDDDFVSIDDMSEDDEDDDDDDDVFDELGDMT